MKKNLLCFMLLGTLFAAFMLPKESTLYAEESTIFSMYAKEGNNTFATYDEVYSYVKEASDTKKDRITFTVKNYNPEVFYVGKVFYDIDNTYGAERGYYMQSGLPAISGKKDVTFTYEYIQYKKYSDESSLDKEGKIITSEKMWYQTVKKMLKESQMELSFNGLYSYPMEMDGGSISIIELMINQHSEYNYDNRWTITTGSDGSTIVFDSESFTLSQRKNFISKTDKKVDSIIKKIIKKGMTQEQKVRAIHDYIVKNCKYDLKAPQDKDRILSYTAYGCLINKTAVCQGYVGAFNLLLQKAGVKSIGVAGSSRNNSNHMWSLVLVDKAYKYFDVTWDDPVPDQGSKVTNTYFALSKAKMLKDHTWNTKLYTQKYLKY